MWSTIYLGVGSLLVIGFAWISFTGAEPFGSSKYETEQAARKRHDPSYGGGRGGFFYGGGGK